MAKLKVEAFLLVWLILILVAVAAVIGWVILQRFLDKTEVNLKDMGELPEEFIAIDLETNGLSIRESVLEIFAAHWKRKGGRASAEEIFHRYYYPVEPLNPKALAVNNLTLERIKELRGAADYPEHFKDDIESLHEFIGDRVLVAHNAEFDLKFLRFDNDVRFICTMRSTARAVQWKRDKFSLKDAAQFWEVEFDKSKAHGAEYDAIVASKIAMEAAAHDCAHVEVFTPQESSRLSNFRKRHPK